jgi:ribosomal-protein-alanine N-acetyltransferase
MSQPQTAPHEDDNTRCTASLRHPRERDRAEYLALLNISKLHLEPWWATPPDLREPWASPVTFDRLLATSRTEASLRYFIIDRGAIAGGISIGNISKGPFLSCTIGYWLGSDFTGRGLAGDALMLLAHFIFRGVQLHRCEANIMPRNTRSIALVQRLGFRYEGTALRYLCINYTWEDHQRWAITREEYTSLCARGQIAHAGVWTKHVEM